MRIVVLVGATTIAGVASLMAQCQPQFTPWLQRAGLDLQAKCCVMWDPDGAGPMGARLVVGGSFTIAGDTSAARIAVFDPTTATWSTLGSGVALAGDWLAPSFTVADVRALCAAPNGDLFAAGRFSHAGGVAAANVARWDGVAWRALGGGTDGPVDALARLPNGDLVATGNFQFAGGVPVSAIARWNGTAWQPFGSGLGYSPFVTARAICVRANGDLIASVSDFSPPFSTSCSVLRWTGSTWNSLGAVPLTACRVLLEAPNGTLLAAGSGTASVQAWNGTQWAAFGGSVNDGFTSLAVLANGDVLAGSAARVARSVGGGAFSTWATCDAAVRSIGELPSGDVVLAGQFTLLDGVGVDFIGQRVSGSWQNLVSSGTHGALRSVVATPQGAVVGGSFTRIAGVAANRVAQWDGVAWSALGSGLDNTVSQLVRRANGDVIASGAFTIAGGLPANGLARWDGVAWSSVAYVGAAVTRVHVMPNDDVLVAGFTGQIGGSGTCTIQRWNGITWATLPNSGNGAVTCFATLPNGDVAIGGWFSWFGTSAQRVVRWNGSAWSPFASGLDRPPNDLAVAANGHLLAAGSFYFGANAAMVARFDGTAWSPMGPTGLTNQSKANVVVPIGNDGALVAGGIPELDGLPARNLVRITPSGWWNVGPTPAPYFGTSGDTTLYGGYSGVLAKAVLPGGDVLLAGTFSELAGVPAAGLLQLTIGCAPSVGSLPTGCIGPAGPLVAVANSAPAVGGTFATQCSGFAATSLAVAVFGTSRFATPLPLASASPLGLVGCLLFPTLDYLPVLVPGNGIATHGLAIANSPTLVGLSLWHQFVQVDFDTGGTPRSLSVSNGLRVQLQ